MVWNLQSVEYDSPFLTYRGHHARVNAVTTISGIPSYGPGVASASDDQTVQVWAVIQGKPLLTYAEHHAPVTTVTSSPILGDDRVASGDTNGLVHVWTFTRPQYR